MAWSIELWPGEIEVRRETRQRKEIEVDDLIDSIRRRGQLQPIVITRDNVLVAGERRLTAIATLADRPARCVYTDEIDPAELEAIELEENVKRKDLPWLDRCLAVHKFHKLQIERDSTWTALRTSESLGFSAASISNHLAVAEEILLNNEAVINAPKFSTASGIVERKNQRRVANETSQLLAIATKPIIADPSPNQDNPTTSTTTLDIESIVIADLESSTATGYILNEDFKWWAESYDGPKFNFIHCDFPYGVGMHKSDQGSGDSYGTYEDTPEIYWSLIDTLLNNLDNYCADSAHLMFWFSMDYYHETLTLLSKHWKVNPFPLIWVKTDNSGILPDPNRGPRRTYETALLASRGDRKIVRPVSNHIASPIQRGQHMSEKPQLVLGHFFRMLVDEHSAVLDPTAGSGSAIRAAATAGAARYLGLEINPDFASAADEALNAHLKEIENAA